MTRPIRAAFALMIAMVAAVAVVAAPVDDAPRARAESGEVVALVLEGTGFGHGRGLSQWGAYGYAVDHGWAWTDILDHYYGGTNQGTTDSGKRIDVRLLKYDGLNTIGVISHGAGVEWNGHNARSMYAVERSKGVFDVYWSNDLSCQGSTTLTVPDGPINKNPGTYQAGVEDIQRFLNVFGGANLDVDGYFGNLTDAALAAWQATEGLPVDGTQWDSTDATRARQIIDAAGGTVGWGLLGTHTQTVGNPLRFTTPGGDSTSTSRNNVLGVCSASGAVTHYRGAIEVVDTNGGNRVVNDVLVEGYLRGVVPKEISASWGNAGNGAGMNAVKAQSVAARSYGLSESRSYTYDGSSTRYATTCDTTSCQVYAGSATRSSATGSPTRVEQDRTDEAIAATASVVRKWPSGNIVRTEFSASNGPRTAGGEFPPVNDIGDDTAPNPNHRWTRVIDAHDFAEDHGLGTVTDAYMAESKSSQYSGFDGIWFDDIVIEGTGGTFRQQAWDFRGAQGLKSPGFTVRVVSRDATGKTMGFIGDSVGNSIAHSGSSEFRRLTDGTYASRSIDVVDSRCTTDTSCAGTSGVQAVSDLPADLDIVVVELGYNDDPDTFADDIDAMMSALTARGARQVAWVNMADIRTSGGSSYYGAANAALEAAESEWGTLTVLDWDAASDTPERVRWFNSDGVHLTTTGQAEFALWLREELVALTPAHYLSPPSKIVLPVVGETLEAPDGTELVVPDDATGVALNVAVVRPEARGFGTVWPCQGDRPVVANVNFEARQTLSNSVIAPISDDGTVCLYSSVGTHLVVDMAGWFSGSPTGTGADPFVGLVPERRVDTRVGTGGFTKRVTPTTPISVPVAGTEATRPDGSTITLPVDVAAVALNVAVVRPDRKGFVTAWPCGVAMPVAANLNFDPGAIVSNGVVAPVGADGSVCIHVDATADVVVDLAGYLDGSSGGPGALTDPAFRAATPTRLVDTRERPGNALVRPASPLVVDVHGATLDDPAGGELTIPADATAVALNLAIVNPSANGFATVWPCDAAMPVAANVNFRAGANISNGVVAPIGEAGTVCVFVENSAAVVVDVAGWFRGGNDASFVGAVPERLVDTRISVGPAPS